MGTPEKPPAAITSTPRPDANAHVQNVVPSTHDVNGSKRPRPSPDGAALRHVRSCPAWSHLVSNVVIRILRFGDWCLVCRVEGLGLRVWCLEFVVWDLEFGVPGAGFGVWGLDFWLSGAGFGVRGLDFEVPRTGFGVYDAHCLSLRV